MATYPESVMSSRTQLTEPWKTYQKRYATGVLRAIGQFEPWRGDFLVPADPLQMQAIDIGVARAPQLRDIGTGVIDLGQAMARGDYLDIAQNPYAQAGIAAATAPVRDILLREALPRITSASIERGSYSGIRPQLAKVAAAGEAARIAGDISSGMALDIYGKERQFQLMSPTLIQAGMDLNDAEMRRLAELGAARRGFSQEELTNELLQHRELTVSPLQIYNLAAQPWSTVPQPTTTTTRQPYAYGPGGAGLTGGGGGSAGQWTGAAGGAIGGAAMAASAASSLGLVGAGTALSWNPVGWMLLAGAALGGAAGYFGSG